MSTPYFDPTIVYSMFRMEYDSYENQSFPIVKARDLDGGAKHYSFDELMQITDRFRSTFICYTLFGTLHRGDHPDRIGSSGRACQNMGIFFPYPCDSQSRQHTSRIHDELNLLRDLEIKSLPNVVKLI